MLKQVIKTEREEQELGWFVLLDGICEEEEYRLWEEEGEPVVWMMQVHAVVQRLGRTADKFDAKLSEEEFAFAWWREQIWQDIRQGDMGAAENKITEYIEKLEEIARYGGEAVIYGAGESAAAVEKDTERNGKETDKRQGNQKNSRSMTEGECSLYAWEESMPKGEQALHWQFLALARAEIARRQARPYAEQLEIILSGLKKTIPEAAWGMQIYQGKALPQLEWLKKRRLHLMEQFLLARFARVWECMGEREEAFLWYQGLSEYLLANVKDRADLGKLYPLLCYRMAENRLYKIFGKNTWWEKTFDAKIQPYLFAREDGNMTQALRDAQECLEILLNYLDALKMLCWTQKQYPLFQKIEHMYLMIVKNMQIFGSYTTEENTWRVLEGAWEDVQKMVSDREEGVAVCDNFDPDYMERSLHSLEELLYERMEMHGLDIYGLGDGIYADPKKSLTPILKGTAKPKPKKHKKLQQRLGMHWGNYDPGFLTKEDAEYKKYARMMRAYYGGKYEEGRKLLEELEEKMDWGYETNEQFGTYWDALFDWKQGKITEQEKNVEMWKVVEYTGVKKERLAEVGGSLMRPEWRALMEIAWNYEGEDLNFLARVLKKQKEYLEEKRNAGFFREYYIKILYCLCHIERKQGNLDGAEQYADKGLQMMYWLDMYTQWGALLFEKFRIVEERKGGKGLEEGDFKYIRQAYAVEKMFLKNEMFCVYIEEYLSEAYGQDMLADIKRENEITHQE